MIYGKSPFGSEPRPRRGFLALDLPLVYAEEVTPA